MAVVAEWMLGNTRVTIHDDAYRDKTPEELELVRESISRVALKILQHEASKLKEDP